jgi:hypothetical protein
MPLGLLVSEHVVIIRLEARHVQRKKLPGVFDSLAVFPISEFSFLVSGMGYLLRRRLNRTIEKAHFRTGGNLEMSSLPEAEPGDINIYHVSFCLHVHPMGLFRSF